MNDFKKRLAEMASLKKDAPKELFQQRGRDFETLVNDIFESEGILLKNSYHTSDNRSEQIDGAVIIEGRIFLIEAKWVSSDLAASALYSFIGKVENKFHGTLGIFISKKELTGNFIEALNKGRRQSVIVLHGDDLDKLIDKGIPFHEYIRFAFRRLSYDSISHFPLNDFLNVYQAKSPELEKEIKITERAKTFISGQLLAKTIDSNVFQLELESLSQQDKNAVFKYVISRYPNAYYNGLKDGLNFHVTSNFRRFLIEANISKLTIKELAKDYYSKLLPKNFTIYYQEHFRSLFSPYFNELDKDVRSNFEQFTIDRFTKELGSYHQENEITDVISPVWEDLSSSAQKLLGNIYLEIYISDRTAYHSQKKFAIQLLTEGKISKAIVEKWLVDKLIAAKSSYDDALNNASIASIAATYKPIAWYLDKEENWTNYIKRKLEQL